MYIVAIGWLYVAMLIALSAQSVAGGVLSFLVYGLFPSALMLWLGGSKARRQRRRHQELLANQRANESDGGDPKADQQDLLERRP